MRLSKTFWIIFFLLLLMTGYALYFYFHYLIAYSAFLETTPDLPLPEDCDENTSDQICEKLMFLRNSYYNGQMYLIGVIVIDTVATIITLNSHLQLYKDHRKKKKAVPFDELPDSQKSLILANTHCNHCKGIQPMDFVKEIDRGGIKWYELKCLKCNNKTQIRKN